MHWMRKPRLSNAVATVAVETVFSLLRVASLSLVMSPISRFSVIPGWSERPDLRCAIAHRGISRFRVRFALRNDLGQHRHAALDDGDGRAFTLASNEITLPSFHRFMVTVSPGQTGEAKRSTCCLN